ncbi:tungstate transport system substrate-binding protein [Litoreibacter ponti]|uniref:Tungstate transport system substrate-binding protein n=1 Tax=Litoreibacter ponti TaxID=1510457 RepID=A0A2T6BEW3_9RHOB|nr:substrate-binding domain-containing protein [Litoreibacter ponti]PTX54594.1 tungstate transport system substrate-binding protein [Litoreibacter ponti]
MIRLFIAIVALVWAQASLAETLRMAVTTSFHNSGLSEVLLPAIEADTGLEVQLLVVGTGQAIRLGEAGDVDAILVHSRAAEDAFVEAGFGTHRREIMYNDFVVIGPEVDPAGVGSADGIADAMGKIAGAQAFFVSRGDDSGTHKKELSLWRAAGLDPEGLGAWYKSVGAGMGAALNTAAGLGAHIMSDRASWLNFGRKDGLAVLFEGDPALFNQYAYLPVNPAKHPHVRHDLALQLEAWLVSDAARTLIDGYRIGGEQLFTFNATQ